MKDHVDMALEKMMMVLLPQNGLLSPQFHICASVASLYNQHQPLEMSHNKRGMISLLSSCRLLIYLCTHSTASCVTGRGQGNPARCTEYMLGVTGF